MYWQQLVNIVMLLEKKKNSANGLMPVIPAKTDRIRITSQAKGDHFLSEIRLVAPASELEQATLLSW